MIKKLKYEHAKNKKKITCRVALAGLPVICAVMMTGCQWTPFGTTTNDEGVGKEKLITDAVIKMNDAQSMDADIDAKMTAKAEISGIGVGVNAATDMNVKSAKADNASYAKGNVNFEFMGEKGSLDIETYSIDKDNMRYTYFNEKNELTGDSGWIVTRKAIDNQVSSRSVDIIRLAESDSIKSDNGSYTGFFRVGSSISDGGTEGAPNNLSLGDLISLYSAANDSLAELTIKDGTQTIDGKECYVVEGPLKGENVKALTDGLGFSIPGLSGLPQPDLSEINADIKFYFEKETRDPYIIELGIPNVSGSAEGNPIEFGIENIDAKIKFNSFNLNNEIKVPEEVEKNAVISVDTGEIQSLFN